MLRSVTAKCLGNSQRTVSSLTSGLPVVPAWGSYGGVVSVGTVVVGRSAVDNSMQSASGLLSSKPRNRYFSSNFTLLTNTGSPCHHGSQFFSPTPLTQNKRWTSTTTQTPNSAGDDESKSLPSPHFKTRKNLETQKGDRVNDNVQAAVEPANPGGDNYLLPHPIWSDEEMDSVEVTHQPPKDKVDKAAYYTCKTFRFNFDFFSGFTWGKRTERKWIYRIIFLETVAGVPGMVAAMSRHLMSLRRMQRDHGWIHTLLEEAENERMHLMTALEIKKPSLFFRLMVLGAQGIFVNLFFISYLISPRFCHRFVGYLEEEAVITYTKLLKDLKAGALPTWKDKPVPEIAINYWKLAPDADFIDLFRAIRADEAHHREVNHTLSDIKPDQPNPYGPGQ